MTEIKIDLDSAMTARKWTKYASRTSRLLANLGLNASLVSVKTTRKGYHVYISVSQNLSPCELVLCQAILGSDPFREVNNYRRVRAGVPNFNRLFIEKRTWRGGRTFTLSIEKPHRKYTNILRRYIYSASKDARPHKVRKNKTQKFLRESRKRNTSQETLLCQRGNDNQAGTNELTMMKRGVACA